MSVIELTDDERDLISSIRNYRKTYPRSIDLELYIEFLLDKLME
ncbi:MAG: hypothetical protein ACPF9U_06960 [Flavobacteriaceae bacterium]